jgi:hypothetical protein
MALRIKYLTCLQIPHPFPLKFTRNLSGILNIPIKRQKTFNAEIANFNK